MHASRAFAASLIATGSLLIAPAWCQAPGQDRSDDRAIRCGTLLTGDGTTVMHDVWLVVRDGKIASIGKDAPPAEPQQWTPDVTDYTITLLLSLVSVVGALVWLVGL